MNQPTVLYIDDDMQSRMVMEILLVEDMRLPHVTIFGDSADILTKVEGLNPKPDVVLLDIHMKPYSGLEVLAMLRNHPDYKTKVIIAVTASVMNEEVAMLQQAGFDGVIGKPIEQETFPDKLARVARGERLWMI